MSTFALVQNGIVVDLRPATFPVAAGLSWTPDISAVSPPPLFGWSATETNGTWSFSAPAAPPPTPGQEAMALLAGGLAVSATGSLTLSGVVFPADATTQQWVNSEMIALLASNNAAFADGSATISWPDAGGAGHTLTPAQFRALATVLAAFVSGCVKCMNGLATALPAASVTIAMP